MEARMLRRIKQNKNIKKTKTNFLASVDEALNLMQLETRARSGCVCGGRVLCPWIHLLLPLHPTTHYIHTTIILLLLLTDSLLAPRLLHEHTLTEEPRETLSWRGMLTSSHSHTILKRYRRRETGCSLIIIAIMGRGCRFAGPIYTLPFN